jgi:transcriptional regulator of heat shock response
LKKEIDSILDEQATLHMKLQRKRKLLEQAEERAKSKLTCLIKEVEEEEVAEREKAASEARDPDPGITESAALISEIDWSAVDFGEIPGSLFDSFANGW